MQEETSMPTTLPKRLALASAVLALSGATAEATNGLPPLPLVGDQEFDFEEGVLFPFEADGDAGVLNENVIEGNFSAFINTDDGGGATLSDDPAVGFVCSFLDGPEIFPETQEATLRVEFEVRYKTAEDVGSFEGFEDPFHTQLVTGQGAVDVLTIKTDGIFFPNSLPRTVVFEEAQEGGGDVRLPRPPLIPTFVETDFFVFDSETRELSVRSALSLSGSGCDPVRIKFNICDWGDDQVASAAFIDEVQFDFINNGAQCPPPDLSILEHPGPRE
jgi:hypothetical protein